MADIFVSYSRRDTERVQALVQAIEAHGVSLWWDRSLEQNENFPAIIRSEIKAAKVVLVCWSEAASDSHWVLEEADEARHTGKYAGCMIAPGRAAMGFNTLNNANLVEWTGAADDLQFLMLLADVGRRLNLPLLAERAEAQRLAIADADARRQADSEAARVAEVERQRAATRAASESLLRDRLTPGQTWRPQIPGIPAEMVPLMVTIPAGRIPVQDQFGEWSDHVIEKPLAVSKYPITFEHWKFAVRNGASPTLIKHYTRNFAPMDEKKVENERQTFARTADYLTALAYVYWLNATIAAHAPTEVSRVRMPKPWEWVYAYASGVPIDPLGSIFARDRSKFVPLKKQQSVENAFGLVFRPESIREWAESITTANKLPGNDSNGYITKQMGFSVKRDGRVKEEQEVYRDGKYRKISVYKEFDLYDGGFGYFGETELQATSACIRLVSDIVP